ncbi:hypothetical protein MMAD_32190 [Mycolicibacterium madagascariense]|uniref:Uncharacterized protein n=1 Tax=Mycolicibacterium madagascariense TaxID=212765 RepID=A0A7I7XIC0_9MYCO|nr:hypothetical protein MMAD_32190 [Mycolicibacterium madagascariense]
MRIITPAVLTVIVEVALTITAPVLIGATAAEPATVHDVLRGAATIFAVSSCQVTGARGPRNGTSPSTAHPIHPAPLDTVYLHLTCNGG